MLRHRQAFHGSEAVLLSFILSASASCPAMLLDACRVDWGRIDLIPWLSCHGLFLSRATFCSREGPFKRNLLWPRKGGRRVARISMDGNS